MKGYIIRRLLLVVPTVLILSLMVFMMVRLIPGDIIDLMIANMGYYEVISDRSGLEAALGLDVSLFEQYGRWLGVVPYPTRGYDGILQGSLGISLWKNTEITELISSRWMPTFELGIMSILVSLLFAVPIGIFSAMKQDTIGDYIARIISIIAIAVPSFWIGTMVVIFGSQAGWYSVPIRYVGIFDNFKKNMDIMILPAIVLGTSMSGTTARMMRTQMLEVLRQDYIRTAWSKGLKERAVIIRHALKNSLIPVVTIIGMQLPTIIGGSVIIEEIFNIPGLGTLLIDSTLQRDYTITSAIVLIFSVVVVLSNLLVDLAYSILDPKITYK